MTSLQANPLTITKLEADAIDTASKKQAKDALVTRCNAAIAGKAGLTRFDLLPSEAQTVIASVAFQYGDLARRTPTFWKHVTAQDWTSAVKELRSFGDAYASRRTREADLLARLVRSGQSATITASVGERGKNLRADVLTVQNLLKAKGLNPGRIDGLIGPNTIAAIKQFQSKFLPRPDGLVEPGKTTMKKLAEK